MLDLPETSLYSSCVFGGAGLAAGLLGLLACRQAPRHAGPGLAPALLGLTGLGACSAVTGSPTGMGWPLLALAGLLILFRAARSDWLAVAFAAAFARARAPHWQWAALAVGCPAAAALLAVGAPITTLELPPVRPMPLGTAVTDRGHDAQLSEVMGGSGSAKVLADVEDRVLREHGLTSRVIRVTPADWSCNCHGWIFAGGRFVMADGEVERILQDNGYRPVEQPEVGDLAVYRDTQGLVCHSARVWAVGEEGYVLLESKWAWMGRYLHPPDATPYGNDWTYYRSPRLGHQLHRIEGRQPEPAQAPLSPGSPSYPR